MILTEGRGPEWVSNPDLCDASAVLFHLSDQANWELVVMWVHGKHVDSGYLQCFHSRDQ